MESDRDAKAFKCFFSAPAAAMGRGGARAEVDIDTWQGECTFYGTQGCSVGGARC